MLSSSKDYLEALRAGKYLRFLEWPQFIAEYYKANNTEQDADQLINLLVYDWLNNGFCEEDAQLMALLCNLYELESKPFRGTLDYAFVSISIAVLQCMVYENKKLQEYYLFKEKKNKAEINELINSNSVYLERAEFEECLVTAQTKFSSWVKETPASELEDIVNSINSIVQLRYCVDEYLSALDATQLPFDELKSSRISVIKRLGHYLNDQMEFTPEVNEQIILYVKTICDMHPAPIEKQFLNIMSPGSFSDTVSLTESVWSVVTSLGISFFNILQSPSDDSPVTDVTKDLAR